MPKISVILPVFNRVNYVSEAIESILNQTYTDFELILLDDGSTDGSTDILYKYKKMDNRIKVIRFPKNRGLVFVLNYGISIASGEYIARMDSDDISLPDRFSKQVSYLENHPEVGLCGAGIGKVAGTTDKWYLPFESEEIKCRLLFHCSFIHPSVMIRKKVLDDYNLRYNPEAIHAEDYELWRELVKVTKCINLNEVLVLYRVHSGQISEVNNTVQNHTADMVRKKQLRELGIEPTNEQMKLHIQLANKKIMKKAETIKWIQLILTQNNLYQNYDHHVLKKVLCNHAKISENELTDNTSIDKSLTSKKICFAILVYKNKELIKQLIRNIKFFCPNSLLVIFNGGQDPNLVNDLDNDVLTYPYSRKLKYGFTSIYLIEIMEWLQENDIHFDFLINLDCDVLFYRSGFEKYIEEQMADVDYMGIDIKTLDDEAYLLNNLKKEQNMWKQFFSIDPCYRVFNVCQIISKPLIEALLKYEKLEELKNSLQATHVFGMDEVIIIGMLRTFGFKYKRFPYPDSTTIRYRPHFTIKDFIATYNKYPNSYLCHPINRNNNDLTRNLIYALHYNESDRSRYRIDKYPWYNQDPLSYSPALPLLTNSGCEELVAREKNKLSHYYKNGKKYYKTETFTTNVKGNPLFFEGSDKNFEVITSTTDGKIVHWWRDNQSKSQSWHGPVKVTEIDAEPIYLIQLENHKLCFIGKVNNKLACWIRDDEGTWKCSEPLYVNENMDIFDRLSMYNFNNIYD
ncbi:glycosyltransferase family 2 protein [Halalkalibacter kiskunsagensis]|uniref:Glycosyltransferase family 2 protein n=1 Tax=Halalkalibacter kiskunsagensis TaxID=1548599 RepID=A0ABV6KGT2_9BACI